MIEYTIQITYTGNMFYFITLFVILPIFVIFMWALKNVFEEKYPELYSLSIIINLFTFLIAVTIIVLINVNQTFLTKKYYIKAMNGNAYQEKQITEEQYNKLKNSVTMENPYITKENVDEIVGDLGEVYYDNKVNSDKYNYMKTPFYKQWYYHKHKMFLP